ncbi:unnamed protein product, partial [Pylaiella littoralis]
WPNPGGGDCGPHTITDLCRIKSGVYPGTLKDRQNRDGVFSVLCQYIRRQLGHIRLQKAEGIQLEWAEHCMNELRLRIDGEPLLSPDYSMTTGYKSWYNDLDGAEIPEEKDNGIGEGELQAL